MLITNSALRMIEMFQNIRIHCCDVKAKDILTSYLISGQCILGIHIYETVIHSTLNSSCTPFPRVLCSTIQVNKYSGALISRLPIRSNSADLEHFLISNCFGMRYV